jgi:hypothetical protein
MPTAYYEKTTPYSDYKGRRQSKENDFNFDDDDDDEMNGDDPFENDENDLRDIFEAFNPNVQVRLSIGCKNVYDEFFYSFCAFLW